MASETSDFDVRKRTLTLISAVAFVLTALSGWLLANWLSYACLDWVDSKGQLVGECYSRMAPVEYVVPLLVAGAIAVAIYKTGRQLTLTTAGVGLVSLIPARLAQPALGWLGMALAEHRWVAVPWSGSELVITYLGTALLMTPLLVPLAVAAYFILPDRAPFKTKRLVLVGACLGLSISVVALFPLAPWNVAAEVTGSWGQESVRLYVRGAPTKFAWLQHISAFPVVAIYESICAAIVAATWRLVVRS